MTVGRIGRIGRIAGIEKAGAGAHGGRPCAGVREVGRGTASQRAGQPEVSGVVVGTPFRAANCRTAWADSHTARAGLPPDAIRDSARRDGWVDPVLSGLRRPVTMT